MQKELLALLVTSFMIGQIQLSPGSGLAVIPHPHNNESRLALGLPLVMSGDAQADLELIQSIGPTLAERIQGEYYRRSYDLQYGNITCREFLDRVPGIGAKLIERFQEVIQCEAPQTPEAPPLQR